MQLTTSFAAILCILACGSHAVPSFRHVVRQVDAGNTTITDAANVATAEDNVPVLPVVQDVKQDSINDAACKSYSICVRYMGAGRCSVPEGGC